MLVRLLLALNFMLVSTTCYAETASLMSTISANIVPLITISQNPDGTFIISGEQPLYATYDAATNTEMFYY